MITTPKIRQPDWLINYPRPKKNPLQKVGLANQYSLYHFQLEHKSGEEEKEKLRDKVYDLKNHTAPCKTCARSYEALHKLVKPKLLAKITH